MHSLTSRLRRRLLATAASTPAFGLLTSCSKSETDTPGAHSRPLFFSNDEKKFVEAACARLIPDGDENNGAIAAAVPFFIDRQLAGPYGQARTRYSQG